MTKVNINGHEHQVEIEHDGDLDTVVKAAPDPSDAKVAIFGREAPRGRVTHSWDGCHTRSGCGGKRP